eukprot:TRINITY_DN6870_c1_g1_i2.p1 TRINITY_DN6870_c1_g1~~TRINITY_DN6870_c1_g1_i2.p1  ORF type:complete len:447 (+),score=81.04 TRINITY_DN6870_c1_g1_i2:541-1881(+)
MRGGLPDPTAPPDDCQYADWEDLRPYIAELEAEDPGVLDALPSPRPGRPAFEAVVTHAIVAYWGLTSPPVKQMRHTPVYYAISCSHGSRRWSVARRYSDFVALHQSVTQLMRRNHGTALPALPGGRLWRRTNSSQALVLRRRDALAAYISAVVALSEDCATLRVHLASFLTAVRMQLPLPPPPQEGCPGAPPAVVRTAWQLPRTPWSGIAVALPWAVGGGDDHRAMVLTPKGEDSSTSARRARDFLSFYRWCSGHSDCIPTSAEAVAFLRRQASMQPAALPLTVSLIQGGMLSIVSGSADCQSGPRQRRDHSSLRPHNFAPQRYKFPLSCQPRGGPATLITLTPPPAGTVHSHLSMRVEPLPGEDCASESLCVSTPTSPASSVGYGSCDSSSDEPVFGQTDSQAPVLPLPSFCRAVGVLLKPVASTGSAGASPPLNSCCAAGDFHS